MPLSAAFTPDYAIAPFAPFSMIALTPDADAFEAQRAARSGSAMLTPALVRVMRDACLPLLAGEQALMPAMILRC
jgi:hypothetical protein